MPNRLLQNVFLAYNSELYQQPQPLKNRKAIGAVTYYRTPGIIRKSAHVGMPRPRPSSSLPEIGPGSG